MTYKTILTSKGTTTIPVEIRKKLGIEPGMFVSFEEDKDTGRYFVQRSRTVQEIRAINKVALKQAGTSDVEYKTGDGFATHVKEKYGK
jgi:bifunctional DNA-binding transcriptional regulator/antitoxin component of YhaV-PrlF toxin-antitoxin module